MNSKLNTSAFYHLVAWLVLLLLLFFQEFTDSENNKTATSIVISIIGYFWILITTNYINLYIWKYHYKRKRILVYAALSPFIFILSVSILQLNYFLLRDFIPYTSAFKNGVNVIIFFLITAGIDYLEEGARDKQTIQELQIRTNEMELNALKSQLNPHFFFNTLNNIYGSIKADPKTGAEMILSLSDVIRYHMQSVHEIRVNIEQEWSIILDYINIEKLRLVSSENLNVKGVIINQSVMIPPLILFPIIENAFKHGTNPSGNWFIKIHFEVTQQHIRLIVENSLVNKTIVATNMGISNLQRRLTLIYGDRHRFISQRNSTTFHTQLEITL